MNRIGTEPIEPGRYGWVNAKGSSLPTGLRDRTLVRILRSRDGQFGLAHLEIRDRLGRTWEIPAANFAPRLLYTDEMGKTYTEGSHRCTVELQDLLFQRELDLAHAEKSAKALTREIETLQWQLRRRSPST